MQGTNYIVALFKYHLSEVATLSKDAKDSPHTHTFTLSFPALFFLLALITF